MTTFTHAGNIECTNTVENHFYAFDAFLSIVVPFIQPPENAEERTMWMRATATQRLMTIDLHPLKIDKDYHI